MKGKNPSNAPEKTSAATATAAWCVKQRQGADRQAEDQPDDGRHAVHAVEEIEGVDGAGEPEHGDGDCQQAQVDFAAEEPDFADRDPAGDQDPGGNDLAGQFLPAPQADAIVQQAQGHDPTASDAGAEQVQPVFVDLHVPRGGVPDQPAEHGGGGQEDRGPAAQGDGVRLAFAVLVGMIDQADAGRESDRQGGEGRTEQAGRRETRDCCGDHGWVISW